MDAQPTWRCPLSPPRRWPLRPPACHRRIVPSSNVGNVGTRARIPIVLSLLFHSPGAAAHIRLTRARPNIANITPPRAPAEPRRATTAITAARGGRPSAPKAIESESHRMRDGYVVDATKLPDMEREFGGRDD
jgi:hypothetical protein